MTAANLVRATCLVALLATVVLLAACGGGDPEPDVATPSVNCALQPVVCK